MSTESIKVVTDEYGVRMGLLEINDAINFKRVEDTVTFTHNPSSLDLYLPGLKHSYASLDVNGYNEELYFKFLQKRMAGRANRDSNLIDMKHGCLFQSFQFFVISQKTGKTIYGKKFSDSSMHIVDFGKSPIPHNHLLDENSISITSEYLIDHANENGESTFANVRITFDLNPTYIEFFEKLHPVINEPNKSTIATTHLGLGDLLLIDEEYCDFEILVEERKFKVHKCILASQSEYFSRYFNSELSKNGALELSDVSSDIFELIVDYLYKGSFKIFLEYDSLVDLLILADRFQIPSLFDHCKNAIPSLKKIDVFCALKLLKLTNALNSEALTETIMELIQSNYNDIKKTKEWETFVNDESNVGFIRSFLLNLKTSNNSVLQNSSTEVENVNSGPGPSKLTKTKSALTQTRNISDESNANNRDLKIPNIIFITLIAILLLSSFSPLTYFLCHLYGKDK